MCVCVCVCLCVCGVISGTRKIVLFNFFILNFNDSGSFGIICWTDCRNVSVLASEFHDVGGGVRITGGWSLVIAVVFFCCH